MQLVKPITNGLAAFFTLLLVYGIVVTLISGWNFAKFQFGEFWYYIIALALGFGIQIALYTYLKNAVHQHPGGKVVAVSGTTSTVAMISCCAHYLANILPILGVAGFLTLVAQYQIQLFWVGLAFNLFGIFFLGSRIQKVNTLMQTHEQ